MNGAPALPRWLVGTFLALLVLPFDPYWFDAEQVRRGLLLIAAGGCALALPALRPVRGERLLWAFVGCLVASALVQWLGEAWFADAKSTATFQPWDAVYRVAHWLALVVALRVGAADGARAAFPVAVLLGVTSLFGVLQRAGVAMFAGYGSEREPVTTLGNLNVAAEWTAVATMVVAASWATFASARRRRIAAAALLLAGCYLLVNGSRSALVALPIGLAVLVVLRRRAGGWRPLPFVAAGAAAGLLLGAALPTPPATGPSAERAAAQRAVSTLDVRLEITKGTAALFASSPVLGLGPGQFAVHYPRVRSAEEIELSSHGRQFATEVRTAHDDWLELLIDGGLVALVLFAATLFAWQRAQRDKAALLPLLVLMLLMFVRAPLWNAPAVVAALVFVGVRTDAAARSRVDRRVFLVLGALLIALGVPVLVANHRAAAWQAAVARTEQPRQQDVAAAVAWMPWEPRWLELLTREQLAARDFAGAAHFGARALQLRPHHPQLYLNLAEVLAQAARPAEARAVAQQGLRIDPVHPELRVLTSVVLAAQGDVDGAIAAVVQDPHPALRAQLANHFAGLAREAARRRDETAERRYRIEQHFVAALDLLGRQDAESLAAAGEHTAELLTAVRDAGRRREDARAFVVAALHALDLGKPDQANDVGKAVPATAKLENWQRELFGDQLERLRSYESWQGPLTRR